MREIKRKLALLLTACMVLNMVVPANGEEAAVSEEIAAQQEMTIEDVEKTDYEEASPAYAAYDDSDAEEVSEASPDGAEYADKVLIRETVVDGIKITLIADAGVFPEGAELWAEKVEDEAAEEAIEEAVEKERDKNVNVASSYKFNIKMLLNGEEIQPDTSKGSVKVTFTLAEELSECLEANAYHLREEADGELTAENLGAEVKTVEEASEETVKETGETSEKLNTVGTDEYGAIEDGIIEDDVTDKVTRIEAEIDGFSYYVVEFTYDKLQYVLDGDSSIKLSEILKTFAIEGTVSEAEVSNEELFTVTKDAEGDDWTVTALQAFTSKEWLKVTINGQVYEIVVTDEQNGPDVPYFTWDEEQKKLVEATCSNYTVITSADSCSFDADTWYVVKDKVDITNRITNNGTTSKPAHLILTDGCTFNVPKGIRNAYGFSLFIYGQTNGTGTLTINSIGDAHHAGIGGESGTGGTVTINGGTVTAAGGWGSAGIGGGHKGFGGEITINGGTINATGGYPGGAGIGSGFRSIYDAFTSAGIITINGGTINATGRYGGAGIGSGENSNGGSITINDGTVYANGNMGGAGIGGGDGGAVDIIIINGGTLTAKGGTEGAGIGSGANFGSRIIVIKGGSISAKGGNDGGAGIGGGLAGSGGDIDIYGGTVTANGGKDGCAAIGGGLNAANHGTLAINNSMEILAGTSEEDCKYKSVELYSFSRDTYAMVHAIPTYTITWKDWDGKLLASVQVEKGGLPVYPLSSKPTRNGYIFTGWNKDITLATADTTYTATYEKKSSGGGGGGGSGSGGGGSAGGPSSIVYAEKPAVTPITIAANGAQMMGTAVISIPTAQLAKSGAAPVPGAWSKANGMWTYTKADGNKAKNEWVLITVAGGNASYFYFDSNGNMVTGWQQVGGKWMYFNNEIGSLLGACLRGPGRTPDGYEIDASGAWTGR